MENLIELLKKKKIGCERENCSEEMNLWNRQTV